MQDGLAISLWGMGVVFVVLIVLGGAIYLLSLLDRRSAAAEAPPVRSDTASSALPPAVEPAVSIESSHVSSAVSPQIVAVIGTALALAQAEPGEAVAAPARTGHAGPESSAWLSSGLSRQMSARTRPAIRRNR